MAEPGFMTSTLFVKYSYVDIYQYILMTINKYIHLFKYNYFGFIHNTSYIPIILF